ncbi:hypothetical protein PT974_09383 [Cladobotryum mycophilum]|uniref:Uncharacterized protein n=1 Tax=Cladobotryum mycophilum TaxID=491253 RepID=A0ABR0SG49_9HYPO
MSQVDDIVLSDPDHRDLDKIAKGWSLAMKYSTKRLKRVHELDESQLDAAISEGHLILETVCLFVHSCIKSGQYKLPAEFWRVLHSEYGIVVYPSALTEKIDVQNLGVDFTFTEAYNGHIALLGRCDSCCPPPCPFQYLREPPPAYDDVCKAIST